MRGAERLLRFTGVGVLGAVVQLNTVCALVRYASVRPVVATTAGVSAAVVHNFVWHYRGTWSDRAGRLGASVAFARFVLANGVVSLAGNSAITWAFTRSGRVNALGTNVMAIVICAGLNYQLDTRVVFPARAVDASAEARPEYVRGLRDGTTGDGGLEAPCSRR